MIAVVQHLPKAYLRPTTTDLTRAEPLGTQPHNQVGTEDVIEAEWRPISGPPVRAANVYRANSAAFAEKESSLIEDLPAAQIASRYQQMTPDPQLLRGTLIDIQA